MSPSETYTSWDIKISLIVFNEAKQRQFQKWNEDDLRNEDSLNNEDDLKNEEDELHPVQAHTTLVVFVCTVNVYVWSSVQSSNVPDIIQAQLR